MAAEVHWFISETYSESASSVKTYDILVLTIQKWWFWFEKQRTFRSVKKVWSCRIALLDENSVWMLEELAEAIK